MCLIFCNVKRKDMIIPKKRIDAYFSNSFVPAKGRDRFLQKVRDDMYASCW